ncbi:MAG: hypothetical protein LBS60_05855 [Deltaproteobacteria bacterium]|jgi:hypothetical protein|nr:hypothetical protein [Deltaproteobacteria bacterium]
MFISSELMGYLKQKKIERPVTRSSIEAPVAASPGGERKKSPPVDGGERKEFNQADEEVDYLNARSSTLDVVL